MKNKQFLKLLLGIFIMPTIGFSQIVNSGQMVVSPGTIIFQNAHFYGNTDGTATGWKQLD